jgi:hypothetical protein
MEQEHPIPQQISAYQFRLVGDMTLKQFFQVAGGALVALLVYASTLPSYVKWPLIIFSFLTGVAFAFFPLQDRPLSTWLVLFIKAIYSPTLYVWKRGAKVRQYFQPELGEEQKTLQPQITEPQLKPVAHTLEEKFPELEKKEQEFLSKVAGEFKGEAAPQAEQPVVQTQPKTQEVYRPQTRGEKVVVPQSAKPKVKIEEHEYKAPETQQVQTPTEAATIGQVTGGVVQNAQQAKFSDEAAPPMPPTKANVVVGQVIDPDGKIVENAILEIKDNAGRPVRALKSNKLGHFMIVTPLSDGDYEVLTEKEGLKFEPISLKAKGEIIPPIAIWASGREETKN